MKPSDKPYWRGKGPNPKTICPLCGCFMVNTYIFPKRKKTIAGLVCENGHFIQNAENLKLLKR